MYKFIFKNKQVIEVPIKSVRIGTARWNGVDAPKYLWIWIKTHNMDKKTTNLWTTIFYSSELLKLEVYSEDDESKLINEVIAPTPFQELHYEDGDIVISYGDTLYSDDAY